MLAFEDWNLESERIVSAIEERCKRVGEGASGRVGEWVSAREGESGERTMQPIHS